jgi:cell wall-associated NlpC family hydrolase
MDAGDIDACARCRRRRTPPRPSRLAAHRNWRPATRPDRPDGLPSRPPAQPDPVKAIIAAGNQIASKPYKYGGGHGKWNDSGYDCSGSVSYALHGAGLLDKPLASGDFESWATRARASG